MQKSTIILFISFILFSVKGFGQGEFKDYQEAEKWLWSNIENKIYHTNISPNWIEEGDSFWYNTKTRKGQEYFLVDIKRRRKTTFSITKKWLLCFHLFWTKKLVHMN